MLLKREDLIELKKTMNYISTGSSSLDEILGGGLKSFAIIEIYGEAGTGKTRLIHQFLLYASREFQTGVFMIDNEGNFRPSIIKEMLAGIEEKLTIKSNPENFGENPLSYEEILRRIKIAKPFDNAQFLGILNHLKELQVKFLAIDNLVTHLRTLKLEEYIENLKKTLMILRELANKGACVVFTNQVTFKNEKNVPVGNRFIDKIVDYKIKLEKDNSRMKLFLEIPPLKNPLFFRITSKGFQFK